jgi:hypothetical protein
MANSIRLHRLVYPDVRQRFGLSVHVTANAIRYVANQYLALHTAKKRPKTPSFCKVVLVDEMCLSNPKG